MEKVHGIGGFFFRARDPDGLAKWYDQHLGVAQLRSASIEVDVDAETYPNGKFARLQDPEGNPIQLWEPGGVDKSLEGA
jgi:glyoxylase I family protein